MDAVFADMVAEGDVRLVEKLGDPAHSGPFLSKPYKQAAVDSITAGGANIHREAILDRYRLFHYSVDESDVDNYMLLSFTRMEEICCELHSLKHNPRHNPNNCTFGQRMVAQTLPMDATRVAGHIKRHILEDQHTLVKLLKGEKGLHELHNITVIDTFREETTRAIQDCSEQIADVIMARLLVGAVASAAKVFDLGRNEQLWRRIT